MESPAEPLAVLPTTRLSLDELPHRSLTPPLLSQSLPSGLDSPRRRPATESPLASPLPWRAVAGITGPLRTDPQTPGPSPMGIAMETTPTLPQTVVMETTPTNAQLLTPKIDTVFMPLVTTTGLRDYSPFLFPAEFSTVLQHGKKQACATVNNGDPLALRSRSLTMPSRPSSVSSREDGIKKGGEV